jgi:hypothetical protein
MSRDRINYVCRKVYELYPVAGSNYSGDLLFVEKIFFTKNARQRLPALCMLVNDGLDNLPVSNLPA